MELYQILFHAKYVKKNIIWDNFSYYFSFPIFWELYGFLLDVNMQQTFDLECSVFQYFPVLLEFVFPMFQGQYYWCENW